MQKYCKVNVSNKYRDMVSNLLKRQDIVFLNQDKGGGVVILDRHQYTHKIVASHSRKQFTTLTKDRTKTLESKVQQTLPKIKSKLTEQDYRELHQTGTCPEKFYGTANISKIPVIGNIDDFSITPIVSNINTATYNLAKYLLKLLAP